MGIFGFLKNIMFGEDEKTKQKISSIKHDVLSNIDFLKAIQAHIMWKKRLQDYVKNQSDEVLDPEIVALDNKCDLGKWIHGQGKKLLGDEPFFYSLQEKHAIFHSTAAKVIRLQQEGKTKEADDLINADYDEISEEVIAIIKQLNKLFTEKTH